MYISYGICTHNEGRYVTDLLNKLMGFISKYPGSVKHEIVILDDYSTDPSTQMVLRQATMKHPLIKVGYRKHEGDFSAQKNALNEMCSGDWIVNLDADEWITEDLMAMIPLILDENSTVEAYWVPRVNIVDGVTLQHVRQWKWVLTAMDGFTKVRTMNSLSEEYALLKAYGYILNEENGYVTYKEPVILWPDPQMRIYKKSPKIKWVNKVHERLTGFEKFATLPITPEYAIRHYKDIQRQESQNKMYEQIASK